MAFKSVSELEILRLRLQETVWTMKTLIIFELQLCSRGKFSPIFRPDQKHRLDFLPHPLELCESSRLLGVCCQSRRDVSFPRRLREDFYQADG